MRVLVNYTPRGQKPEDLEKHLNYIMDEKKTLGKYIYCYRCNKEDPLSDMKFVKKSMMIVKLIRKLRKLW